MRICSLGIIISLIALCSCSHKNEAIELSKDFFYALSDTTYGSPCDFYPLYDSLNINAKSDVVDIDESEVFEKKDTFEVHCFNNYTDEGGTFKQDSVILFIAKDSTKQLKIVDSRGLIVVDKDTTGFGNAIGAFKKKNINDLKLAKTIEIVKSIMFDKYLDVSAELREKVKILNWSWETSYSGDAHGEGRIVNNLDYSITGIKYHVTYYDRRGDFMAEDDGSISKTLYPGEKYNFTFWSSNAKYPNTASLRLQFSDNTIFEIMKSKHYTGKEYNEYVKTIKK